MRTPYLNEPVSYDAIILVYILRIETIHKKRQETFRKFKVSVVVNAMKTVLRKGCNLRMQKTKGNISFQIQTLKRLDLPSIEV